MNRTLPLLFNAAVPALTLTLTLAFSATSAFAAAPVPPAPVAPRNLPFSDRVAGRHLLYDARAAYQGKPAVSFSARWTQMTNATSAEPGAVTRGTETLRAELAARRLSLSTETITSGGDRSVVRAIANGQQMVATKFLERKIGKTPPPPTRDVFRLPLDEGVTIRRALQQVQVSPQTRGADLLLNPNFGNREETGGALWREGTTAINGVRAALVAETEPAQGRGNVQMQRMHRYAIEPNSHRLLRYEEWIVSRNPDRARAARKNRPADDGSRTTYRREDYDAVSLASRPLPAATYAQSVPANYAEKPLPSVNLPPLDEPPAPDAYAPQALALLEKWRNAYDRAYTLAADVQVSLRGADGTPGSELALSAGMRSLRLDYQVTLRKPDQARVLLYSAGGGDGADLVRRRRQQFPDAALAVSDGDQVRVIETGDTTPRTVPLPRSEALWAALNRAGLRDRFGALQYLFNPPPRADDWDQITYDGATTLDNGEAVDVLTMRRSTTGTTRRRRQEVQTETVTYVRVSLSKTDHLPRLIETQRVTSTPNGNDWNQLPPFVTMVRLRRVTVDAEPSASAFTLPAAPPGARPGRT